MFRAFLVCTLSALGVSASGCGSDSHGGISELFEALNGDYEIREESDCVIAIRGSRFETRTSTGATTCMETYTHEDGSEGQTEMLQVSGTLSDTRLSGMLLNEESWPFLTSGECQEREGSGTEIVASATKLTDRSTEGRFAALAGTWEGEVEIAEYWFTIDCEGNKEKQPDRTGTYTFTADVNGDSMDITYDKGGDPKAFEVLSASSGDVIVDGEIVRFESE